MNKKTLKVISGNIIIQGVFISVVFTFIFLYSVFFNISSPIEASHFDTFHVIFTLKHYMDTVINSDWKNILQMPMFYGSHDVLLYSELFIVEALMALPVYAIFKNIIITFNILSVFTIFLSFLSMFIFVRHAIKKTLPAILASIIYVFNPFVMGHFPDNLHYYSLEWIPLIFLFVEKSLTKPDSKNEFLVFIFLIFQLLTTLTFGALLTVILPLYILIRIYQLKVIKKISDVKKYITVGAIIGALMFVIATVGINMTYNIYFEGKGLSRNLEETATFSPWVSDLFFTAPNNILYGWLRQWSLSNLPEFTYSHPEYIERDLFFGITVWILLITSFFVLRKSTYRKIWITSIICGVLSMLLSFGPEIRFSDSFASPGVYGIFHNFNPLLQNLRVASRFMVLAFFFFGLISSLTLIEITKYFNKRTGIIISLVIILFVTIEYSSMPWKFTPFSPETKSYYSKLQNKKDINVVLELPMGNLFGGVSFAKDQFIETQYMLFASTLHNKKLLNGYSSYTPEEYPERIIYLTANFPTSIKINQLKRWGVNAISLHRDEFIDSDTYYRIKTDLEKLGMKKIEETPSLVLFRIK